MTTQPPAPYPDGFPDDLGDEILDHGARGKGTCVHFSTGDYMFSSGCWKTIHGPAVAVRIDEGAFAVWGALLPGGQRVHCRRSQGTGAWRRRSDDGRSWVIGHIKFETDDVLFTDGLNFQPHVPIDVNIFESTIASLPEFISQLKDDSFAFTLNHALWFEALCTLDGDIGWNPSRAEAAETIVRLRGFGEHYRDFELGGLHPKPPETGLNVVLETLASAGWRFQTAEEVRRFDPSALR